MVLLNGVKYACERCIRGHRVSSCTHTDKPLTMIKPKGRPASQCPHCREQRKLKNTHSSCSCGKKGKSPGTHLASCLCHKNSHCTCPTKEKKAVARKKADTAVARKEDDEQSSSQHFLIEDVLVPFESEQGLLDYLSSLDPLDTDNLSERNGSIGQDLDQSIAHGNANHEKQYGNLDKNGNLDKPLHPQQLQGLNFPNPPSDADLDLMENMFPLFPLVGSCSFDDSKSLPLLPMPYAIGNGNLFGKPQFGDPKPLRNGTREPGQSLAGHTMQHMPSGGNLSSTHQLSTSLSTMNTVMSGSTQHPRPLKPSTSFSGYPHQNARPRRPESVLSIASTSSNTSKNNFFENPPQQALPKLSSSAAFPPFHLSESNSTDDFNNHFGESVNMLNDRLFSILSDEDTARIGLQSALPSRQPLQTRRKTSLSRSHSQLHHNISKEHTFIPLKSASSSDSSPHQPQVQNMGFPLNELAQVKHSNGESHLRKVAEEVPASVMNDQLELMYAHSPSPLSGSNPPELQPPALDNGLSFEFLDSFPMYQEIFKPVNDGLP